MKDQKPGFKFVPFVISLFITLSIGGIAGFVNVSQINGWYSYLNKPSFNPPDWLFGPVWTILYIMIAWAAYLVWEQRDNSPAYIKTKWIYFIQLLLNFSWSVVFFGLHQIFIGLIIIILLFVSIIINVRAFNKFNKLSGLLLIPYLLWVGFATILNLFIYMLNK